MAATSAARAVRPARRSAFRDGLVGLAGIAVQVAHHLGDLHRSPVLIFASYSWARRDHMVRLMRARPFSVSSACCMFVPVASLRRPEEAALLTGTRSVIRFSSKVTTMTCKA